MKTNCLATVKVHRVLSKARDDRRQTLIPEQKIVNRHRRTNKVSFYGGTRQRLTPNDGTIKMNFTRKSDDPVSRSINFIRFSRFLRRPPRSLSMNLAFRQLLYVFSQRCAARASGKFTGDIRKTPRDRLFRRCILLFSQKLPRIPRMVFFALTFMQITLDETSPDFLLVAVC